MSAEPENNLDQSSPEIQEIFGKTPPWVLRAGTGSILGIVLLIFLGSWFIKLPVYNAVPIKIYLDGDSLKFNVIKTNRALKLLVNNYENIANKDPLLLIDSKLNKDQILILERINVKMHLDSVQYFVDQLDGVYLEGIQGVYNDLIKSLYALKSFNYSNSMNIKILKLENEINKSKQRNDFDVKLLRLQRDSILSTLQFDVKLALKNFCYYYEYWRSSHLIVANCSGVVSFENRLKDADEIIEITIQKISNSVAKGELTLLKNQNINVVKGQINKVKINNYSHEKYGVLNAKVMSIDYSTFEDSIVVNYIFENGLQTSTGAFIQYNGYELDGVVEVLKSNDRLFYKLVSPLNKDKLMNAIH